MVKAPPECGQVCATFGPAPGMNFTLLPLIACGEAAHPNFCQRCGLGDGDTPHTPVCTGRRCGTKNQKIKTTEWRRTSSPDAVVKLQIRRAGAWSEAMQVSLLPLAGAEMASG